MYIDLRIEQLGKFPGVLLLATTRKSVSTFLHEEGAARKIIRVIKVVWIGCGRVNLRGQVNLRKG